MRKEPVPTLFIISFKMPGIKLLNTDAMNVRDTNVLTKAHRRRRISRETRDSLGSLPTELCDFLRIPLALTMH